LEGKILRGNATRGYGVLILFVITGAVLGGILGEIILDIPALSSVAPYLVHQYAILDLSPVMINLYVIKLSFGFALHPNLISILGVVLAIFLFKRV
jgi:hypothetical protein